MAKEVNMIDEIARAKVNDLRERVAELERMAKGGDGHVLVSVPVGSEVFPPKTPKEWKPQINAHMYVESVGWHLSFLCRTPEQRNRLCAHLINKGYTQIPFFNNDEMLYLVIRNKEFSVLPGNRGTWSKRVPDDLRSEGELFERTGTVLPERMFTREDMIYFSDYTQEYDKRNGQGSGDPKDLFYRKFEHKY